MKDADFRVTPSFWCGVFGTVGAFFLLTWILAPFIAGAGVYLGINEWKESEAGQGRRRAAVLGLSISVIAVAASAWVLVSMIVDPDFRVRV